MHMIHFKSKSIHLVIEQVKCQKKSFIQVKKSISFSNSQHSIQFIQFNENEMKWNNAINKSSNETIKQIKARMGGGTKFPRMWAFPGGGSPSHPSLLDKAPWQGELRGFRYLRPVKCPRKILALNIELNEKMQTKYSCQRLKENPECTTHTDAYCMQIYYNFEKDTKINCTAEPLFKHISV